MRYSAQLKQKVRDDFLYNRYDSVGELAEAYGLQRSCVLGWINRYGWKQLKRNIERYADGHFLRTLAIKKAELIERYVKDYDKILVEAEKLLPELAALDVSIMERVRILKSFIKTLRELQAGHFACLHAVGLDGIAEDSGASSAANAYDISEDDVQMLQAELKRVRESIKAASSQESKSLASSVG